MKASDNLVVGFDFSNGKDLTCLTVGRLEGNTVEVLNYFDGKEAEELYRKLISKEEK